MLRSRLSRSALALAASVAILAGCETPPAPVVEAPVAVAPPPPPPPPPVAVYARVVEQAAAFENYMVRAGGLTPSFTDGASVGRSLTIGAAYEPRQLATGLVAYGAVAALQDPTFVEGVRAYLRNPEQRAQIAAQIAQDPAYIAGFPGAAGAAGLVAASFEQQGSRVRRAGEGVKQAAYSVQRQAWSKATIPNREERLASVKALGTALAPADTPTFERLRASALGQTPATLTAAPLEAPYTPVVIRSLAIAALSALGYGEDPNFAASFDALLVEPTGGSCLNMSKLNLNQCLAVARPWYEDVFCLGQHVLIDTGQCVQSAGRRAPAALAAVAVPVTPTTAAAAAAQANPAPPTQQQP